MPNYSKSKIYKLTSSNSNDIYIGSTVLNLCKRKAHHIHCYKKHILGIYKKYITSFKIIEYGGDIDICLLEVFPCNNKEQLHQKERFYIENNECVNKIIPTRTAKEYREINKDDIKQKRKEHYNINKDKLNYYTLNKDKIKQYYELNKLKKKEYYELNKEKIKEQKRNYYELNKDIINMNRRKLKL